VSDDDLTRRGRDIDYGKPLSVRAIRKGRHRTRVGGQWDELGELQLEFMIAQGLRPEHRLLLAAGYEHELTEELRDKLPREHLRATDRFDCDFGVEFDFAIAQSLFTHISLNQIRLCLFRVASAMPPGGRFLASYFEAPRSHPLDQSRANGRLWTERNALLLLPSGSQVCG
jgi:hypothetical protein